MTFLVASMIGGGFLLIYSAIEDVSLRDTFTSVINGTALPKTPTPLPDNIGTLPIPQIPKPPKGWITL